MTINEPTSRRCRITWVDETDSTQEELRRHIEDHDNLSVVAAEHQTAGRGQRGNDWHSQAGMNLTFSMLLRFGGGYSSTLKASDQFGITRAMTLGVSRYLEEEGVGCRIKWPNDIYVRNRKICGMLIENVIEDGMVVRSIVGIGLNLNQRVFPLRLPNPTSLSLLTGKEYRTHDELEKLCSFLADIWEEALYLPEPGNRLLYTERLYRLGEFHDYVRPDGSTFEAMIVGTTRDGLLQTRNRKGELEEFAFKEISYVI